MISPSDQGEYPVRTGIGFGKHQSNSAQAFELKYNFKPDSIDDSRPSTLTRSGLEFTLESPGIQNGESFFFNGQHSETKDIDCLLVYDKETESFFLHHVSGIIRLKPQRSAPRQWNTEAPTNGYHQSQSSSSISSSANSPAKPTTLKVPKDERVIELPSLEDEPDVEYNSQPEPESRFDGGPESEPTANANAKTGADVPLSPRIARRQPTPVSDEDESDADDNNLPGNVPTRVPTRAPVQNVDDTSSDEDDDGDINMTNVPPQNREVESSDEDAEDVPPPPRHAQASLRSVTARAPISLRGYTGGGRVEDDISSSSEEE
ncbi:RNA polymerase II transcription elongation factor-domain-containing protein [Lipomyces tetrasporus]